jgi:hypothetical protein
MPLQQHQGVPRRAYFPAVMGRDSQPRMRILDIDVGICKHMVVTV